MGYLWDQYKATVFANCTEYDIARNSVKYWKNQLFAVSVTFLIPMSMVALVPGVYKAWNEGLMGMLAADFLTMAAILSVAFLPGISLFYRKLLFNAALYFISFVLLYYLGSNGPGLLYLLTVTIFVLLSLNRFYGYVALGLNVLTCIFFSLAIYYQFTSSTILNEYQLDSWIGVSSNLIFLSGTLVFLIPELFAGLQAAFEEQHKAERVQAKSLAEKETLLMEIHHRVKNNLATVSGMLQLQAFGEPNEEVRGKLNDSVGRIKTMGTIHELLYQAESFSRLQADVNIRKLVSELADTYQAAINLDLDFRLAGITLNINQAIPISLIVNEVVTNVLKHAFEGRDRGKLSVELTEVRDTVQLKITDNGIGLPDDFGASTNGDTLGLQLIDTLADQLEGNYRYHSENGGTQFLLSFEKQDVKGAASTLFD